jgi:MFS family permease
MVYRLFILLTLGGQEAWLTVAGGFICLFCSFGMTNAIGVFQTHLQWTQLSQYTPFELSWIFSVLIFFMNGGGVIVGPLFDMFGPQWLLMAGTIVTSFGLMMTSISTEYYQFFLSFSIVTGIGVSLLYIPFILFLTTVLNLP